MATPTSSISRRPRLDNRYGAPLGTCLGLLLLAASVTGGVLAEAEGDAGASRCLALNLYWEARSEGRRGMIAVAWVVLNRVADPRFPDSVCAVVHQGGETPPCAWSWWCDGKGDRPRERGSWREAQAIARQMLTEPPPDPTAGSLWMHAATMPTPRRWRSLERTVQIGGHVFYR